MPSNPNRRSIRHTRVYHPQGNYVDGVGRRWFIVSDSDPRVFQSTFQFSKNDPAEVLSHHWENISEAKYAQRYSLTKDEYGIEDGGICCEDTIPGSGLETPESPGGGGPWDITDGVNTEQIDTGDPHDTLTVESPDDSIDVEVVAPDTLRLQVNFPEVVHPTQGFILDDGTTQAGIDNTETLRVKSDDGSVTSTVVEGAPNTLDLSVNFPAGNDYDFSVDDGVNPGQSVDDGDVLQVRSLDDSILPTISDAAGNPNLDLIQQGPVVYYEERYISFSPGGFSSDILIDFFLNNGGNADSDPITVTVFVEEPSLSNKASWVTADILPASPDFTETSAAQLTFDPVTVTASSFIEFRVGVTVTDPDQPFQFRILMEAVGMAAAYSIVCPPATGLSSSSTHTHAAADVTDFDTEVGNHVDVTANTAARHDALTLNAGDATQQSANLVGQELELVQATDSTDGVMSAEDKAKLDTVQEVLLSSTAAVDMQTVGQTNLYTVPAGSSLIVTKIVMHSNSDSLAGGTDYDFGDVANARYIKTVQSFDTVTATGKYYIVGISQGSRDVLIANDVLQIDVITGSTAAATATIDVFGYLI